MVKQEHEKSDGEKLELIKRLYSLAVRMGWYTKTDPNWKQELYEVISQLENDYGFERTYPKAGGMSVGGRSIRVAWVKKV